MSTRTNLLVGMGWWVAIAASALLSLFLAHRQSMEDEVGRAERLANDILARAHVLAGQTVMVEQQLEAAGITESCSDAGRGLLQRIALQASQIRAVGVEREGTVLCFSLGSHWMVTRWVGSITGAAPARMFACRSASA